MTTRGRTARRPGAIATARAARRNTAWDDSILNVDYVSGGATQGNRIMEDVADPEKRGCTVVRILISLSMYAAGDPGAVSGVQRTSLGICTMSDDAFDAAAFPDPNVNADFPVSGWMYRNTFAVRDETLATGIVPFVMIEKDLRVQRKMDRAALVLLGVSEGIQGSGFNVKIVGMIRVLYKLP